MTQNDYSKPLNEDLEDLQARLEEAEETIRAIRSGAVDALVVGDSVYTLKGEERTYRILVESMSEGALAVSPDGTIVYSNTAFSRMMDQPLEKIIGGSLSSYDPDQGPGFLINMLRDGERAPVRREVEIRCPDGRGLPVMLSMAPLTIDDSRAVSVVVADLTETRRREEELRQYREQLEEMVESRTSDLQTANAELTAANQQLEQEVAERIRAEGMLHESEARFSITFLHAGIGMAIADLDGRLIQANRALSDTVGIPESRLRHSHLDRLIDPEDLPRYHDFYSGLHEGLVERSQGEMRVVNGSGESVWCSISASVVRGAWQQPLFYVLTLENISVRRQLEAERENSRRALQEVYERERRIAEALQRNFLPDRPLEIPGYRLRDAYYAAMDESAIGGDLYDVFRRPDGRIGIAIADVSGKGLRAARHGAMMKYMLRAYSHQVEDPGEVMTRLNEAVAQTLGDEGFVTCFFGVLDPVTRQFHYANAGHDEPLHIVASTSDITRLGTTGAATGMLEKCEYTSARVTLGPGDLVLFYTDGVTDARGVEGRMEVEGLEALVRTCPREAKSLIDCIVAEVMRRSGSRLADDVAMLALEVLPDEPSG